MVIDSDSVFFIFLPEVLMGNSKGGIHVFWDSNRVNILMCFKEDETLISDDWEVLDFSAEMDILSNFYIKY